MTINDQIRDEKLWYDIIEDQGQKNVGAFEKQIKTIEDQGQKQVEALKYLKPKAINDKSEVKNSLLRSAIIFNDLISERKKNNEWIIWQRWL